MAGEIEESMVMEHVAQVADKSSALFRRMEAGKIESWQRGRIFEGSGLKGHVLFPVFGKFVIGR
ncbi:hypothetical protein D3C71_2145330 [compost metagenome]